MIQISILKIIGYGPWTLTLGSDREHELQMLQASLYRLLQKKEVDGVITLGAIIKGQTKHDEVIANSTAKSLTELSLKYQKPVSLGITGPGMQERHAYARIRPVAERAVEAMVKITQELEKIKK